MPVLMLFREVGRDMSRWPTAAHFVSWLGLCPDNDISGGRVLWRGVRRTKNRAGALARTRFFQLTPVSEDEPVVSAICCRSRVTRSRQEGRLAVRRHFGRAGKSTERVSPNT